MRYAYVFALVTALVLNATANLLLKVAAERFAAAGGLLAGGLTQAIKAVATNGWFVAGIVCFALNVLAYMYALQKMQISLAYPIMVSCGYAIIVIVASQRMNEHLVPIQWVGIVLMLIGVWLVSSAVTAK